MGFFSNRGDYQKEYKGGELEERYNSNNEDEDEYENEEEDDDSELLSLLDEIENIEGDMPAVLYTGGITSRVKLDEKIYITKGNLRIKGGKITGIHNITLKAPRNIEELDSGGFEIIKGEDKIIDDGNFEILKAVITRTKRGKVCIVIEGELFDNDGNNSIDEKDPIRRVFRGVLKNVKGGYEGIIPYRPSTNSFFQEAIKGEDENYVEDVSKATFFIKEADIFLGDNQYNNDAFLEGVGWKIRIFPKIIRRILNNYRNEEAEIPVLKKIAKLTSDHRLETKFEKRKTKWGQLIGAVVIGIMLSENKDLILRTIKDTGEITKAPTLNFLEPSAKASMNLENPIIYEGSIKIKQGESVRKLLISYLKNKHNGKFKNLGSDLNALSFTGEKLKNGDIVVFSISKGLDGKWNLISIK